MVLKSADSAQVLSAIESCFKMAEVGRSKAVEKVNTPALDHEVWDATVHGAALEVQLLARPSWAALASAQTSKVFGCLRDYVRL